MMANSVESRTSLKSVMASSTNPCTPPGAPSDQGDASPKHTQNEDQSTESNLNPALNSDMILPNNSSSSMVDDIQQESNAQETQVKTLAPNLPMETLPSEVEQDAVPVGEANADGQTENSTQPLTVLLPPLKVDDPQLVVKSNLESELAQPLQVKLPETKADQSSNESTSNDTTLVKEIKENEPSLQVKLPETDVKSETKVTNSGSETEGATCANPEGASDQATAQAAAMTTNGQSIYHIKWIPYKGKKIATVTQNENGPCPLIAIMNVLLLREKIKFPVVMEMVTSNQLMEYLGDCIFEQAPKNISESALLNYEQNMHDAMAVFHKLQTGLDVNVKFTGVNEFEYTSECIIFDLLNIPLYHGWLPDPESPEVLAAVGNCSYNQLVEKIISQKVSDKPELVTEALLAEDFLRRSAAQLTYHGLSELSTTLKDDELGVLFRNNHFSTIYKKKGELFVLVTDQGFLTENNVIWETLSNVEGDGHFVDSNFHTYRKVEPSSQPIPPPAVPVGTDQQVDQDYLVALSLQQHDQQVQQEQILAWQQLQQQQQQQPGGQNLLCQSDHDLAMQLQEEENKQAAASQQQRPRQVPVASAGRGAPPGDRSPGNGKEKKKKDSDCTIL